MLMLRALVWQDPGEIMGKGTREALRGGSSVLCARALCCESVREQYAIKLRNVIYSTICIFDNSKY